MIDVDIVISILICILIRIFVRILNLILIRILSGVRILTLTQMHAHIVAVDVVSVVESV